MRGTGHLEGLENGGGLVFLRHRASLQSVAASDTAYLQTKRCGAKTPPHIPQSILLSKPV